MPKGWSSIISLVQLSMRNTHIHVYPITTSRPILNNNPPPIHYIDVIMTTMASQITSFTVVYSAVYSDADQRRHQSSASLAFVWGIRRDRWIHRTKGQLRRKYFHLMTSSWDGLLILDHIPSRAPMIACVNHLLSCQTRYTIRDNHSPVLPTAIGGYRVVSPVRYI